MDSVLRNEPLAGYVAETRYWWLATLTLGPLLGAVGACISRAGAIGLLSGLTVPVGALLQSTLERGSTPVARPAADWALLIVVVLQSARAKD